MSNMDKNLGYFCLRKVIESYMLGQGWGKYDEVYGWCFSIKEWEKLEKHIRDESLPDGYYQLCDYLGESYTMGFDINE